MIHLGTEPLDVSAIMKHASDVTNGAIVTFLGTTRNHSEGRQVLRLEYEAYEPMARQELQKIAQAVEKKWGLRHISIAHRFGNVELGEASLVVAVGSAHRAESFAACQFIVDNIKKTVPIWKKEIFADGEAWVGI